MSNPLPIIIVGPAIATWNGKTYYYKNGLKVVFKRETFSIETDFDGKIDERAKSQMTEVSGQPVGKISSPTDCFPYTVASIGQTVFNNPSVSSGANLPLVIVTKFGGTSNLGQTITYPRAAMTKLSQMKLHATETWLGEHTFTCLGDPTVQPNTSGAWETIASATFADTSFDETKIVTDIYSAAWGSSPYNAMGSMAGWEIDIAAGFNTITADDYGIVDMILKELTATARFVPSNLTQANASALLSFQGAGYIFPGQSLAKSNTDLVIAGSGNNGVTLTATIKNAGPKDGGFMYDTKNHRLTAVSFTSKRTWTAGAANALFTLAAA